MSLSELRELVIDREAWHAVIHGVTKSRTRLDDWTELNGVSKAPWIPVEFRHSGDISSAHSVVIVLPNWSNSMGLYHWKSSCDFAGYTLVIFKKKYVVQKVQTARESWVFWAQLPGPSLSLWTMNHQDRGEMKQSQGCWRTGLPRGLLSSALGN